MAAWFDVYCARSVAHVTAKKLRSRIESIQDVYTLAEGYGIDDNAAVDKAMTLLQIEPVNGPGGVKFQIRYRSRKFRPILYHLWTDFDEELEEALEQLEELETEGPTSKKGIVRVRSHLKRVVQVVTLELGWSQLEDMGVVLAAQVAEYLATIGGGLIKDPHDDWWEMKDEVPVLVVGAKLNS
jgi:hypothetical protein